MDTHPTSIYLSIHFLSLSNPEAPKVHVRFTRNQAKATTGYTTNNSAGLLFSSVLPFLSRSDSGQPRPVIDCLLALSFAGSLAFVSTGQGAERWRRVPQQRRSRDRASLHLLADRQGQHPLRHQGKPLGTHVGILAGRHEAIAPADMSRSREVEAVPRRFHQMLPCSPGGVLVGKGGRRPRVRSMLAVLLLLIASGLLCSPPCRPRCDVLRARRT